MRRLTLVALVVVLAALFPAGGAGGPLRLENVCACGSGNWIRIWDWQQGHWDCWDNSPGGVYIHGC